MPFEHHPTDPDKLVMRAGNYNLQKPWVGLTDEEMCEAVRPLCRTDEVAKFLLEVSVDEYRAIEAKLKEKNT